MSTKEFTPFKRRVWLGSPSMRGEKLRHRREACGDGTKAQAAAHRRAYSYAKRGLDILIALAAFIPASLIVAVCGFMVKLDTRGPAFFVQERAGYKGRAFRILKLRTMIVETKRDGRLLSDLERTTRVGKVIRALSIDELPQIINVLLGQMSFIGPRPLPVAYLPLYSDAQAHRHDVLPGISGWAQVNGRNTLSWDEKFQYDLWYVNHMSLRLDIKIFFMTIKNCLIRQGINKDANNTMTAFTGSAIRHEG